MALYGMRQSLLPVVERLSPYPNEFESSACATNSRRSMVEIQCTRPLEKKGPPQRRAERDDANLGR
jgi:hypothetical protein